MCPHLVVRGRVTATVSVRVRVRVTVTVGVRVRVRDRVRVCAHLAVRVQLGLGFSPVALGVRVRVSTCSVVPFVPEAGPSFFSDHSSSSPSLVRVTPVKVSLARVTAGGSLVRVRATPGYTTAAAHPGRGAK